MLNDGIQSSEKASCSLDRPSWKCVPGGPLDGMAITAVSANTIIVAIRLTHLIRSGFSFGRNAISSAASEGTKTIELNNHTYCDSRFASITTQFRSRRRISLVSVPVAQGYRGRGGLRS